MFEAHFQKMKVLVTYLMVLKDLKHPVTILVAESGTVWGPAAQSPVLRATVWPGPHNSKVGPPLPLDLLDCF